MTGTEAGTEAETMAGDGDGRGGRWALVGHREFN